ncbi:MAG: hypothetical protein JST67_04730 [Bacteroidetes bacterium]|nr:hypothetical protein [Bacteroidota bacterium]
MLSLHPMRIVGFIFFLSAALFSCKEQSLEGKNTASEQVVARVLDKKLTALDIKKVLPKYNSPKDSALFTQSYIKQWLTGELLLHQAEANLSEADKNIQQELDEYRKSLLLYRYETQLVRQKLDTAVSPQEIEAYYNDHAQNFMLKENIVKVSYVKVQKKTSNIEKVKKWYNSNKEADQESLKKFCIQYADNFFLDNTTWLLLDDVMKEIPLHDYNPELLLKTTRQIELSDSTFNYYLNIVDFKIKNTPSPLSFEKENIRQIIINKRKLTLIEEMKQEIYNQAKENNTFEVFSTK